MSICNSMVFLRCLFVATLLCGYAAADQVPRICTTAIGNLSAVKGSCPAGTDEIRIATVNIFDVLWLGSTGQTTAGVGMAGGPPVWDDALAALNDAKTSGVRVFRYFAALWGPNHQFWYNSPDTFWQEHDRLMDAIEELGLYCVPSIGTGYFWAETANAVTSGLNENINDVVKNSSSVSWLLQARYFEEFTKRYANRTAILLWELGNELNNMVNLSPRDKCGGNKCFDTAAMVNYTERLVDIIQQFDTQYERPISSGFAVPRAAAYHMEHCEKDRRASCTPQLQSEGGYWGLDNETQWLDILAQQNSAVDVVSLHQYPKEEVCYFNSSHCGEAAVIIIRLAAEHFQSRDKVIYVGEYGGPKPNFTGPSEADQAFPEAVLATQVSTDNIILSSIWAFESPSQRGIYTQIWPGSIEPKEAGSNRMMELINNATRQMNQEYVIVLNNTCAYHGYQVVNSKVECEHAAVRLKLTDTTATDASFTPRPEGCFWWDQGLGATAATLDRSLKFDSNPRNEGLGQYYSSLPICKIPVIPVVSATASVAPWGNNHVDKAFDGLVDTYYDANGRGSVVEACLALPTNIGKIRFHPRKNVVGGPGPGGGGSLEVPVGLGGPGPGGGSLEGSLEVPVGLGGPAVNVFTQIHADRMKNGVWKCDTDSTIATTSSVTKDTWNEIQFTPRTCTCISFTFSSSGDYGSVAEIEIIAAP